MKVKLALVISLSLIIFSCKKQNIRLEQTDFKIKTIRTILDSLNFLYDGDKLIKMGNEEFFYDHHGQLKRSTNVVISSPITRVIAGKKSIYFYRYLYAYSYHWEQNKVKRIQIDSLIVERTEDGNVSKEKRFVNSPVCEFFYKDDRIDSLSYIKYSSSEPSYHSRALNYNEKGNIIQAKSRSLSKEDKWNPDLHPELITTSYESYDDKLNPYQIIYENLGTLTPSMFELNYSANNPLSSWVLSSYRFESVISVNNTYQYNSNGLPILIKTDREDFPLPNIFIEYHE